MMADLLQPAKDVEKEKQQRMAGEASEVGRAPAPRPAAAESISKYRQLGDFRDFR